MRGLAGRGKLPHRRVPAQRPEAPPLSAAGHSAHPGEYSDLVLFVISLLAVDATGLNPTAPAANA